MPILKILNVGEFTKTLSTATHGQFAGKPGVNVASEQAFNEMKAHALKLYQGVEARNSFVDENGSIFDCIPVGQQPALRGSTQGVAKAPDMPPSATKAGPVDDRRPVQIVSSLGAGKKDVHGNEMSCPEGYIPMRRVTLEELTRFETLQHFFLKSPQGAGRPPIASPNPVAANPAGVAVAHGVAATHRWAHAFQNVNNLGGHSFINLWDPPIGANQIFSLSQHWYVGGSGANLQTAEVGWQVYPGKYGNTKPVFFIYWTADDYNKTGNYNLDASAFVQTNHNWTIGGTISPISVYGGAQYEIQVAFYLYQGNWWLYVQGTSASNAIGYYPTSLYKGGAMASHASEIDYGGEVVGTTSFPGMGSGHFANQGWQKACYQRDIYYFPTTGGAVYANLTGSQSWPNCYTVQKVSYNPPWNDTIYYGGPGGNC
jgi:hypothetical protein